MYLLLPLTINVIIIDTDETLVLNIDSKKKSTDGSSPKNKKKHVQMVNIS